MPIGATIGALGSLGAAGIGAYASNSAASQQAALGQASLANQNALFDQGMSLIKPFVQYGKTAGSTLTKLLTPGADQTATLSQIPGFQFAQDWGAKAVANQGSTTGFGGNTLKAGIDYATGAAQQGFGNIAQLLLGLTGEGAGAAASAFGNATQTGANEAGTFTGIGNAKAAGTLGVSNALAGGLTGGANSLTNALLLSKLLPGGNSSMPNNNTGIYSPQNPNDNYAGFGPTYFPEA